MGATQRGPEIDNVAVEPATDLRLGAQFPAGEGEESHAASRVMGIDERSDKVP